MSITPLKPFFSYFGSKYRIAPHYDAPRCSEIVEPFAGGAGYSCRYHDHQISLYDTNPAIYEIWNFLIHEADEGYIRSIPDTVNEVDKDLDNFPLAVKYLVGFWLAKGSATPRKTIGEGWNKKWTAMGYKWFWGSYVKERIIKQLPYIKHWTISNADYSTAENRDATWFIDPPYEGSCGQSYKEKNLDYAKLSEWCRSRKGQVIVCENDEARWMDFIPLVNAATITGQMKDGKRSRKGHSLECVWTNLPKTEDTMGRPKGSKNRVKEGVELITPEVSTPAPDAPIDILLPIKLRLEEVEKDRKLLYKIHSLLQEYLF
jgi:site-specific DNA-adenine methylase